MGLRPGKYVDHIIHSISSPINVWALQVFYSDGHWHQWIGTLDQLYHRRISIQYRCSSVKDVKRISTIEYYMSILFGSSDHFPEHSTDGNKYLLSLHENWRPESLLMVKEDSLGNTTLSHCCWHQRICSLYLHSFRTTVCSQRNAGKRLPNYSSQHHLIAKK